MKKSYLLFLILGLAFVLSNCSNNGRKLLTGIWKVETFTVNGTALSGTSLGNWLWEFNDEGGYLASIDGAHEKGRYSLTDSTLTLQPVADTERPAQVYQVIRLDSAVLHLYAATDKNTTSLHFIKVDAGEVGEKD